MSARNFPPLPVRNNNGFMPNTMYMGQMPYPQPAYVPQPGNATAQAHDPCVLPPNMVNVAAPPHAQVASSGVGAGYPHYPFQAAYNFPYPPTCVQSFINPYTSKSIAGLPPQHLSAPLQYNQPSFPSESFAAFPPPYQHHGSELAMGFTSSSLPQVTVSLAPASQKRVGEDCEGYRPRKRAKLYDISRDMEFQPLRETDKHGNQLFKCLRDQCGKVIIATSYRKHFKSTKHQGVKPGHLACPYCSMTFSRTDALTRHWRDSLCARQRLELETGAQSLCSAISQGSTNSASASPAAPTTPFTFCAPATAASISIGSTTSNVIDNVQIPPQADKVTESQRMAVITNSLLAVPASSEPTETAAETAAAEELAAILVGLEPDVAVLVTQWIIDQFSSEEPPQN